MKDVTEFLQTPRKGHHSYSRPLAEDIISLYIDGQSLVQISRLPDMPTLGTILRWLETEPEFMEAYEKSRKLRALHIEEQALEAADVTHAATSVEVSAARLKFDSLMWAAEKHDNERYGKKTQITGGGAPIQIVVNTGVPEPTQAQLPPTLNSAGLIEKVVQSVVVDVEPAVLPTPSDEGDLT